jgi:NADH-quinone oxidoreductase subunit C
MGVVLGPLQLRLSASGCEVALIRGMLVAQLPPQRLLDTVRLLKDEFQFDLFLDVTAIDWLPRQPRFEVVYHF